MKTKQILDLSKILSWIIFIGLCIRLGAVLFSAVVSLFINKEASQNLYLGLDLSSLYDFSINYYVSILSFVIAIGALKAYLFYLVIKIFSKIDLDKPFTYTISKLISTIGYLSLYTGLLAYIAHNYSKWLLKKGVGFKLDWGSTEFLFMGGILFVIALIFKRGVEIQSENELTV